MNCDCCLLEIRGNPKKFSQTSHWCAKCWLECLDLQKKRAKRTYSHYPPSPFFWGRYRNRDIEDVPSWYLRSIAGLNRGMMQVCKQHLTQELVDAVRAEISHRDSIGCHF